MTRTLNVKLLASALATLVLAAVGIHFLHDYQLGRNAYRLREQGDHAVSEKDFDKARGLYAQYLSYVPNDPDTTQKYALVLDQCAANVGDRIRLVLLMEQVLRVKPAEHELRFRLVHNLIGLDRIPEAMEHLRKLQFSWRDQAEVLHMIGWCQDATREYSAAADSLRKAIQLNPKQLKSYHLLAEVLNDRLAEADQAQKVMDDAVEANAEAWQGYLARARFQRRRGDDKAAQADLAQARQLAPNEPEVILEVAAAARARGDWQTAVQLLEEGLSRHPRTIEFSAVLADLWHRLGNANRAEALWRDVARALPRDLASRAWLFERELLLDDVDAARMRLEEIRAIEGETGALTRWGEACVLIYESRGRPDRLAEARGKLQELDPEQRNWPRVVWLSARLSELEGKPAQAIEEYKRALDLGETQPRVLASLVGLLLQRREFSKAESEIARYEQKVPLTKELSRLAADVAMGIREKRFARIALQRARKAIDLPPRTFRDAIWLAHVCRAAGELAEAEALLREALEMSWRGADASVAWLEFLTQTNRREEALTYLAGLEQEIVTPRRILTLARCYEAVFRSEQADQAYREALAASPNDFVVLAYAADFWRRADQNDQAESTYRRLLDPAVNAPAEVRAQARRHLAVFLGGRGALTEGLALLDEKTEMADERVRLYLRSMTPSARPDAMNQFEDSLRSLPASPEERLLWAEMLDSADRPEQARAQLADLVDEFPFAPRYLVRYTRLLLRVSDTQEAARILQRLDFMEPDSDRVRELHKSLPSPK